jgi:hypothetical protein
MIAVTRCGYTANNIAPNDKRSVVEPNYHRETSVKVFYLEKVTRVPDLNHAEGSMVEPEMQQEQTSSPGNSKFEVKRRSCCE